MPPEATEIYCQNMDVSPLGGIRIAGFSKNGKGLRRRRYRNPWYSLVLVTGQSGIYEDGGGIEVPLEPGDLLLTMPGDDHWYGPQSDRGWDEIYVLFEGPVFDVWRSAGCFDWAPILRLDSTEFWSRRILQVFDCHDCKKTENVIVQSICLQELLLEILAYSNAPVNDDVTWIERAKDAVEQAGSGRRAARLMNTPYNSFRIKFKSLVGLPPDRYANRLVMERACGLLLEGSLNVREIADKLDFCDEFHFSKQFQRAIGLSPSDYRQRASSRIAATGSDKISQAGDAID